MRNIVKIENSNLVVTIENVAKFSGNKTKSIRDLIMRNEKEFRELGLSLTKEYDLKSQSEMKLNEEQTTFLMILMRNNPTVVKFKFNLVKQFMALKDMVCETNKLQLEESRKQTIEAKRQTYAKPRAGYYQLVDRTRQDYNIQCSTAYLNKLLEDHDIIKNELVTTNHYMSCSNYAVSEKGSTLVSMQKVIEIVDAENIARSDGWVDKHPTLL